jgi:amino acid permease
MADVIAVVGAFAISLLSFVLPPFCYYRLCSHEMAPMERLSVVAFFFVSIVVMVYATYSAMKTLISHL